MHHATKMTRMATVRPTMLVAGGQSDDEEEGIEEEGADKGSGQEQGGAAQSPTKVGKKATSLGFVSSAEAEQQADALRMKVINFLSRAAFVKRARLAPRGAQAVVGPKPTDRSWRDEWCAVLASSRAT